MPKGNTGGSQQQKQPEKKDNPHRGDSRGGHDRDNRFDDPQELQSKGKRVAQAMPGGSHVQRSRANEPQESNTTTSGGNRPKGSNQGGLDHD